MEVYPLQIAIAKDGSVLVSHSGNVLESVSLDEPPAIACVTDSADLAPILAVAPGQLISLFGSGLAPDHVGLGIGNSVPTSFPDVSVTINGVAAPLLYSSSNQINVQVPFELAGAGKVRLELISSGAPGGGAVSVNWDLLMLDQNASIFVSNEVTPVCAPPVGASSALALNPMGV